MFRRFCITLVLAAVFNPLCFAQIRVAVTPFESADYSLQKYAEYARGELENLILSFGNVEVVERARMDQINKELAFGNFSGMADESKIAQYGKMAGAKILVTGSLLKADTEVKGFGGYGVSTRSSQTVATIRVRACDVEKGVIVYSTTVKGSSSSFSTNAGGSGNRDPQSAAVEDALKNLGKDAKFKELFAKLDKGPDQKAAAIKIEIKPIPDNCDLEVNGVYRGSTPLTLELSEGVTVTIKLTRAGYVPWEKTVMPVAGMHISPELEKK